MFYRYSTFHRAYEIFPLMGWSGRAPAPQASEAGKGAKDKEHAMSVPILIATTGAAVVFVVTLLFSPETRCKELVPQLTLAAGSLASDSVAGGQ